MRFFNIDLHISVIEDMRILFSILGHEIDDFSMSNHRWIFNKKEFKSSIVNSGNWRSINDEMINQFQIENSNLLQKYDGFISTYPPCFGKLYQNLDKPIIINCPIRYEEPFGCNKEKWIDLNNFLMNSNNLHLLCNNKYDSKYCECFLGKEIPYISSFCEYAKTNYNPSNNILYCSNMKHVFKNKQIINQKDIGKYNWDDIGKFKAIVHIPYNASVMKIFENYQANIPMLFPSKSFLLKLRMGNQEVMNQLSFNEIWNLKSESIINHNSNVPDPNDYLSLTSFNYWINFSDFYDESNMPFIEYFDSFEELENKLNTIDFKRIHFEMKNFNIKRKSIILEKWNDLIKSLI